MTQHKGVTNMATFVLVHGGWHGAWCWDKIVPLLEREGHTALAPDLPGHGADTMPLSARPYAYYVPRVCDVLDAQREPVVLVGHSSGGMVITEAAAQRPEKVAALVYLAAFLLPEGVAPPAVMRDDTESLLMASLAVDHERGISVVRPERAREVFYADCTDADATWAISKLQPEPLIAPGSMEPPRETADTGHPPRVYIETTRDNALGPATQRKMYTAMPCERVYSLPTSHSPFIAAPEQLAAHLREVAATFRSPTTPIDD